MILQTNTMQTQRIEQGAITPEFTMIDSETSLPSKGAFYPKNSRIFAVRGLRFREQAEITNIFNSLNDDNQLQCLIAVFNIYKNCIIIEGVPFESILAEDMTALAMFIVLLTNKDQVYHISKKCPKCGEVQNYKIDIQEAEIEYSDMECLEAVTMDTDIGKLFIAPLTVKDVIELEREAPDELRAMMADSPYIKRLNGKELTTDEKFDAFGNLSYADVISLLEQTNKYRSFPKPIKFKCETEGCENELEIAPRINILKGVP